MYKNVKLQNLSAAKNFGFKISKSKLVCFLDDDVSIEKNYILESYKIIKRKKCDLLFSKINQINSSIPLSKNMGDVDLNINFLIQVVVYLPQCGLIPKILKNFSLMKILDWVPNMGVEETDYIFKYLKMKKKYITLPKF